MKPVIYITAAILASIAGYLAVYVNAPGTKTPEIAQKASSTKPQAASQKEETSKQETQKTKKTNEIPVQNTLKGLNKGEMATFVIKQKPLEIPGFEFQDKEGSTKTLADWSGKVVLLNLWATWCAPCREEMPYLDELKHKLGGDNFDVVTISIDRGGISKPQRFFDEIKIKNLALYHDKTSRLGSKLRAFGMPTTILINKEGKEIGRLVGPAEWASDDALTLLKTAIALENK